MTQALELLLDPATDGRVRAEWEALRASGVPSQADHAGDSNAPHVTLATRDAMTPDAESRLAEVAARLPIRLRIGPVALFAARRGWVLARQVVIDRVLLDLHEHAATALGPGGSPLTEPGRWLPHVTLGHGLEASQVARALDLLADLAAYDGTAERLRRWDQPARRAWDVAPHGDATQASGGRSL